MFILNWHDRAKDDPTRLGCDQKCSSIIEGLLGSQVFVGFAFFAAGLDGGTDLLESDGIDILEAEVLEPPGPLYFPPVSALITAGGRLLLAMLEKLVTDAGGTYLMCDTDSMAIVASERAGFVPCAGGCRPSCSVNVGDAGLF